MPTAQLKPHHHGHISRAQVFDMHKEFMEEGRSLRELGEENGTSHEGVRQLFLHYGLETKRARRSTVNRYATRVAAWGRKEEIWEAYREHGNVPDTAEEVGIPAEFVSPVVDKMPMREVYTNRRSTPRYTKEKVERILRGVAKLKGEPLSQVAYHQAVTEHNRQAADVDKWPTRPTIVRLYGSFAAACKAAGIETNEARGPRIDSFTVEDGYVAIRQCLADLGHIPRYQDYQKWASSKKNRPSGSTVRVKAKAPWREIVQTALRTDGVGYPD